MTFGRDKIILVWRFSGIDSESSAEFSGFM